MSIIRTVVCDVCSAEQREAAENAGWPGWGHLAGVTLDGKINPHLCPTCLASLADLADRLKEKHNGMD